ncbi:flippase-like domain-containing protein [Micromonospora sp. CPCC 205371]|nr:flippase-like domain-containing protein [Micromonospora sp. CPCC 205371]
MTALPVSAPPPRRQRIWRFALVAALTGLGLAVVVLQGHLPHPRQVLTALTGAGYGWVVVAGLLQAASLAAFAAQQRRILAALGVRLPRRDAMAITLTRTALSVAVPAGAAVSTGYAIREYQRAGGTGETGAAAAVVSGLTAIGGLALLYIGGGAVVAANHAATFLSWRPLAVVVGLTALVGTAVTFGRRQRERSPRDAPRFLHVLNGPLAKARQAWRAGAALRPRDWSVALAYAVVNWITDLLCFAATTRAFHLPTSLATLAGIYLAVQVLRQVPLTPGGAGVVDTAYIASLTAAGASAAGGTAAVLVYRLLSCWLIIPAGAVVALTRGQFRRTRSG